MIQNLIDAYVALLKVQNNSVRIDFQSTYCLLRDTIANETKQTSKYVQEKYEEIALVERVGGMLDCWGFTKFIGSENKEKIEGWPPLAENYWESYKYAITQTRG